MDEDRWSEEIHLIDCNGLEHPAHVDLVDRDWNEGGYRRTECSVAIRWEGGEASAMEGDFFTAFRVARMTLEASGLLPRCYGASRKVILTGMAANMGRGLKVYRAEIGRPVAISDIVSIFDSGPDVEPVSVEEQDAFRQQWLAARQVNPGR